METLYDLKNNLNLYKDKKVELSGWVKNNRDQKEFGFIHLNDGTTFKTLQVVYDNKLKNFDEVIKISVGSSVVVKGEVVLTPEREQAYEIKAHEITLIKDATGYFPIQAKRHTREFLRTKLELRPRTNLFNAVFRTRSKMAYAIHKFFQEKNFVYVHTPIITTNDGEGAGSMFTPTFLKKIEKQDDFKNDFFKRQAYLTVTGQLHGEAYAQAFRNIYTFGPTFRAEKSNTPKHAAEFWMIEPEMAFCDLENDMKIAEDLIKYLVKYAFDNLSDEIEFFNKFVEPGLIERLKIVLEKPFNKITHKQAIDILLKSKQKFENEPKQGLDIATEHEKYLTDVYFKSPVFIIDWPKDIKAFYMRLNSDNKTVAAMDLLVSKSGELLGGSQREERYDILLDKMKKLNMNIGTISWYLDLRKFGGTTSSGFGMGFERLIMFITGVDNIRDVIPFPRTFGSCDY